MPMNELFTQGYKRYCSYMHMVCLLFLLIQCFEGYMREEVNIVRLAPIEIARIGVIVTIRGNLLINCHIKRCLWKQPQDNTDMYS